MADLRDYALCRFNRNSGAIDTTLYGKGQSMLKLWGLQNTTKTKDTVVFAKDNGEIVAYFEGQPNNLPKDCKDMIGLNIEDIAEGLLGAIQ